MNLYFSIEVISFLNFILFSLLCFTRIENKIDINKITYLFNLLLMVSISLFQHVILLELISNKLALVLSLFNLIVLFTFFLLSMISFQFIRLRILFIPFFFIILVFRFLIAISSLDDENSISFFNNQFLVIHIFTSLLSYSLITISLVTSFCTYIQDLFLKKMKYNKIVNEFLPSMYESELLAIRFLYITIFFLIISLITGLYYFIETGENLIYFFNEKVILSLLTLFLTLLIIIIRALKGLSGQMIFKMIFLSFVLISFSYFGIRLIA